MSWALLQHGGWIARVNILREIVSQEKLHYLLLFTLRSQGCHLCCVLFTEIVTQALQVQVEEKWFPQKGQWQSSGTVCETKIYYCHFGKIRSASKGKNEIIYILYYLSSWSPREERQKIEAQKGWVFSHGSMCESAVKPGTDLVLFILLERSFNFFILFFSPIKSFWDNESEVLIRATSGPQMQGIGTKLI